LKETLNYCVYSAMNNLKHITSQLLPFLTFFCTVYMPSVEGNFSFRKKSATSFLASWRPPLIVVHTSKYLHYVVTVTNTHQYGFPLPSDGPIRARNLALPINQKYNREGQAAMTSINILDLQEDNTYLMKIQACLKSSSEICYASYQSISVRTLNTGELGRV